MIENNTMDNYCICRLCGEKTKLCDMSEEHYKHKFVRMRCIVQMRCKRHNQHVHTERSAFLNLMPEYFV